MTEYLDSLLRPLLKNPIELSIKQTEDEQGILLSVTLHKLDMGRVIGKSGDNIKAIRTIMHTRGEKEGKRVSVILQEPIVK